MERGARLSGSRFAYLKGDLVLLELALVRWALEMLRGHGFEPVIPPVLVREEALYGTGFLPDTEQQIYALPDDELYLVGTSEVALASLHAGEILDAGDAAAALRRLLDLLPPRGRRRRARHARHLPRAPVRQGRDVQRSSSPTDVAGRARAAAGDRGGDPPGARDPLPRRRTSRSATSAPRRRKKYDCEAWLPGQERYRELTSSLEHDRLPGAAPGDPLPAAGAAASRETLHTLNGTAVAVGRTIIALLENGQREDGTRRPARGARRRTARRRRCRPRRPADRRRKAEGAGFEPADELPRLRLSRPVHSTALPSLRRPFWRKSR